MGGWNSSAQNWQRVRRRGARDVGSAGRSWSAAEVAIVATVFVLRWELGLALLALKLWHQASGHPGSVFAFAREKWDGLVGLTRSMLSGASLPVSLHVGGLHVGPRSSGNHAFDSWRQGELARIEAERERLRTAEREFTVYRDELLHAKDRDDFDRFMHSRDERA